MKYMKKTMLLMALAGSAIAAQAGGIKEVPYDFGKALAGKGKLLTSSPL